jgi:hypothetical protein
MQRRKLFNPHALAKHDRAGELKRMMATRRKFASQRSRNSCCG